jgi:hypothetical protein
VKYVAVAFLLGMIACGVGDFLDRDMTSVCIDAALASAWIVILRMEWKP